MKHPVLALVVSVVLAMALSACGDSDDGDDAVSGATTSGGDVTTTDAGVSTTSADATTTVTGVSTTSGDAGVGGASTTAAGQGGGIGVTQALRDVGLGTLASALEAAGVDQVIETDEFTIFAPNNAAFLAIDTETLGELLSDPAQVAEILRNHVVAERLTAEELVAQGQVETRAGTQLEVTGSGGDVTVGGATILEADREVGDVGVIHVIDSVLTLTD